MLIGLVSNLQCFVIYWSNSIAWTVVVPSEMGLLTNLVQLNIEGNAIGRTLSGYIASLPNLLQVATLHANELVGDWSPILFCPTTMTELTADCAHPAEQVQ
jgi:hypothetical protein